MRNILLSKIINDTKSKHMVLKTRAFSVPN